MLREKANSVPVEFVHEAFEGLYALDPGQAVAGLEKLSFTHEILRAVDGISHASMSQGETSEILHDKFREATSEVARARLEIIKAYRAAEEKIKDPTQRREFRLFMLHRHN